MYPYGFRYLVFEIKIKYSHKNPLAKINTKISEINPKENILIESIILNDDLCNRMKKQYNS